MAQVEGWERNLTRSVAAQVRRCRQRLGMSAQDLSDRCAELGVPIPRPVLSNLETGRRESVTLAELIVLAMALEVSPALLIVPVETADEIELLPGRRAETGEVLEWFAGEAQFVPTDKGLDVEDPRGLLDESAAGLVWLYRYHGLLADSLLHQIEAGKYTAEELGTPAEDMDGGPGELRALRQVLREMSVRLPPLPPELAAVDPPGLSREELRDRIRHAVRRG